MDYVLADGFSLFCALPQELRSIADGEEIVAARFRRADQELVVLRPVALWEAQVRVRLDELDSPRPFPAAGSPDLAPGMLEAPSREREDVSHEQCWLTGIGPPFMEPLGW